MTAEDDAGRERIAKAIARAGLCSRRDAERWIALGRVTLNGKKVETPATLVGPDDKIAVDGKPLAQPENRRLWRYHKPKGLLTTAKDPEGRPTVFDKLPSGLPRLLTVGRLDLASEGLLLLTNDGSLKRRLELPKTAWVRRYRVRAWGQVTQEALDGLAKGVTVDDVNYGPVTARLERTTASNVWITFALTEGKNREVRRICEHLGLAVNRLIRVAFGPFQLGELEPGEIQEVPQRVLDEQLGDRPAAKTGRVGFAKAKPRPAKPGSGRPRGGKSRQAEQGAGAPGSKDTRASDAKSPDARSAAPWRAKVPTGQAARAPSESKHPRAKQSDFKPSGPRDSRPERSERGPKHAGPKRSGPGQPGPDRARPDRAQARPARGEKQPSNTPQRKAPRPAGGTKPPKKADPGAHRRR